MTLYDFLAGPCLMVSVGIFTGGMIGRMLWYVRGLDWRKDRVLYRGGGRQGVVGALWSVVMWMAPFAARGSRGRPVVTLACWLFHAGLILVALFLPGHEDLRRQTFGWAITLGMPLVLADVLTGLSLAGLAVLALRRALLPEVSILSSWRDWGILALCGLVLSTGALARFFGQAVPFWLLAHMALANGLLIIAPFTRLSHMVLFFFSRGQLGMDYAVKRGGAKRGPMFPW